MITTEHHSLGQAARIEGFYQNFLSSDSAVENKDDIESEHGFVWKPFCLYSIDKVVRGVTWCDYWDGIENLLVLYLQCVWSWYLVICQASNSWTFEAGVEKLTDWLCISSQPSSRVTEGNVQLWMLRTMWTTVSMMGQHTSSTRWYFSYKSYFK